MPIKNRIQLRDVSSVVASTTVVINLPVGPRYHSVSLQHSYAAGTNTIVAALANIAQIRVKRNGRVQRTMTGTQLRDMNLLFGTAYDAIGLPNVVASAAGTPAVDGVTIPIFFAEPWRQEPAAMDALAWSTDGWESFTIEVDLGAAGTPALRAYAVVDKVVNRNAIVKWLRIQIGAAGTSFDYSTLDKRDFLQQISIYPCSGAPTLETSKATLRVNGDILHELSMTANQALLTENGMTPAASGRQTGALIYDLVLDHDGLLGSAIPLLGVRDVTLTIEAASAMSGTTTLLVQRLGAPE